MLSILQNYSILYVEDELEIQANITEYLKSYFLNVYVASNGKEGLELYKKYQPDVALLDIHLPLMSGLTIAKQIRKKDSHIKIIMLTGHTDTEILLEATELKLTKYLIKPISPKAFKEALNYLANEIQSNSNSIYITSTIIWNSIKRTLTNNGENIVLLEKEQRLLELFINKRGATVSYEDIMVMVWEDSFNREISIDSVKNQVSNLRKKLSKESILSVYGQGYKLI